MLQTFNPSGIIKTSVAFINQIIIAINIETNYDIATTLLKDYLNILIYKDIATTLLVQLLHSTSLPQAG